LKQQFFFTFDVLLAVNININ